MKSSVLVVDDSGSVRELFSLALTDYPVCLEFRASAEEARAFLADHEPQLVFIDIIMPDTDGLTLLRELTRSYPDRHLDIVMMSSKDYAQDRRVAEELGATGFMLKPMGLREIQSVVAQHLGLQSDAAGDPFDPGTR